jgi:hypothetical protein
VCPQAGKSAHPGAVRPGAEIKPSYSLPRSIISSVAVNYPHAAGTRPLQEVLADLFAVRDHALQAQRRGGQPPRPLLRQYEQDLQWLMSPEEHAPFSFGWLCDALGLEASAVRRRYLKGQPVSLSQRHRVGHLKSDKASLAPVPRRARAGKARNRRSHKAPLNGHGHEGNGTEFPPQ